MRSPFELSVEISEPYPFDKNKLSRLDDNTWVRHQWPLVYLIQHTKDKYAYVGESTNMAARVRNHLSNPRKAGLFNQISIIGSDKFNKSATLDLESLLIQYLVGDKSCKVVNGNYGLVNHNYYQQELYRQLFQEVWQQLLDRKIVSKPLAVIENSELFKYSPYKSLNEDQYNSAIDILQALTTTDDGAIVVTGSAGTGKTILATYLAKLLTTELQEEELELNEEDLKEVQFIKAYKKSYPEARIGLVVAMTSLRQSLQKVFREVPGLDASMVLSPSDTFKGPKYDLLIVDEAHRLRKFKNISWAGTFRQNNRKLGLDDSGDELDWILTNSKRQVFFYDADQTVKPSDIDAVHFTGLLNRTDTVKLRLRRQMRVRGGESYIRFVDELLHLKREPDQGLFAEEGYELVVFDSLHDLYDQLKDRENRFGLSRLVAGYAWPWRSKADEEQYDIEIEDLKFQWNRTNLDWIHSPTAFDEVGCIHTTMGYDLNYTGIIFGREIRYNAAAHTIEIDARNYYDINGKKGIADPADLKAYIINIYKNMMNRGIRGTFLYACDPALREYLKQHIPAYQKEAVSMRTGQAHRHRMRTKLVPFIDISVAAGDFTQPHLPGDVATIPVPADVNMLPGDFVCRIQGESMNQRIPNGALCLFRPDEGGSRAGKIVLVKSAHVQDADYGACYTIKEYQSLKTVDADGWRHKSIILKPLSDDERYQPIVLREDELMEFAVVGIFVRTVVEIESADFL